MVKLPNLSVIGKFENSTRIAELNPTGTLIRVGLNDDMVLCDIGAGTGVFAFPAADSPEFISTGTYFKDKKLEAKFLG